MKTILTTKKRLFSLLLAACLLGCTLIGCGSPAKDTTTAGTTEQSATAIDPARDIYALIDIADYGKITVKLEPAAAPITVTNFVNLASNGVYDGLKFHRIMKGFMMQGGASTDPSVKTITGEFASNGIDNPISHKRGAISMARTPDPNSASSQFFIVHQDSEFLDGDYAAFGEVTEGIEVVDAVCEAAQPIDDNGTIPESEQPVINSITIIEDSPAGTPDTQTTE